MASMAMLMDKISVHCSFLEEFCSSACYNEEVESVEEYFEVLRVSLAVCMEVAGQGQGRLLIRLCDWLPVAIKKCIDMAPGILLVSKDAVTVHARIFEILCAVVELVVAVLANHSDLQNPTATLLGLLSFCLDSRNHYYSFRHERLIQREIVTHSTRLQDILQIPGCASLKEWLEDNGIITEILMSDYDTDSLAKVTAVVKAMITNGLMLYTELLEPSVQTSHTRDLITANVLEHGLKNSPSIKDDVIEWLELREISSPLNGRRIIFILISIAACDKERELEYSVLSLFWKHASHHNFSASDLTISLTRIAGHYEAANYKTKTPKESILQSEEEVAAFLKMCSDAGMSINSTECMSNIEVQNHLFVTKSKVWEAKDCPSLVKNAVDTTPIIKQLLAFEMPLTCLEIYKECLRRLGVSQDLISDLSINAESKLASAMASAMSPELQILEMLKKDISVYSHVGPRIRKLGDELLKMYDMLKEEENDRLQRFLQSCEEKKKDYVIEALYLKAKLLARMDRAKMATEEVLSSQDILARMIQKAEEVVKEVDDKYKDSMQKFPNLVCSMCLLTFSLKRKRAYIQPCGHACICVDCADQEFKRTKTCPLCKCCMDQKPVALPVILYC